MTLSVDLRLVRPGFALEARFEAPGGVTALFGRSGAGKTTLALLIAGLIRPTEGRIALDGTVLTDTEARRFVPPHRRRIAVVFQDGRLFPHLTVRQNLAYGAWFARAPRERLGPVVDLLGIAALLGRRPGALSGGEQRRVAIGRALLAAPRLLVLDEPLTGLDARRKDEILPYLERLRDALGLPMIYVSHALDEVVRLADRLVLIEAGRQLAAGPVGAVLGRPDLAGRAGLEEAGAVIPAVVESIDTRHALARLVFPGGTLQVPAGDLVPGTTRRVLVRARDVALAIVPPVGTSVLNILPARIVALAPAGEGTVEVALDAGGTALAARITTLSAETLGLAPGMAVHALIKSVALDRRTRALS